MKTIVITGANRGIGFEFVKQLSEKGHSILATCRKPKEATELQQYAAKHDNLKLYKLDVTNDHEITSFIKEIHEMPIDWLINNAGISGANGVTLNNIERANFMNVINVNCLSALKLSNACLPLLQKGQEKLIIAISSRMGSIADNERGASYAYRTSKAALNCAMRSFALDVIPYNMKVMLLHPGWVQTGMGGEDALITAEESVKGLLEVVEKYKSNSHAEVLRSYKDEIIPW